MRDEGTQSTRNKYTVYIVSSIIRHKEEEEKKKERKRKRKKREEEEEEEEEEKKRKGMCAYAHYTYVQCTKCNTYVAYYEYDGTSTVEKNTLCVE